MRSREARKAPYNFVGGGAHDAPATRLFPQARTSRKQIDRQPNDVRTEFHGCSLQFEILCIPFFDPYKKPMEERGAGGGTVRLWSAVPSPGDKKVKNFKLNQRIANILSFTCSSYNAPVFAGEKPSQTPKFSPPPPPLPWLGGSS